MGPDEMDNGWGREFQKSILKYVEKPYRQKFQPYNAATIMRLRDDGMGDPSADGWGWTTGRKNPKLAHARACQTCAQVCTMAFTDFGEERWDLLDLGKECEHDWIYEDVPRAGSLALDLKQAGAEAETYFEELESLTDLEKAKTMLEWEDHGGVWWDFKLRTRCLSCKALADGTTLDEAHAEHVARRTAKDVARANPWKKTTDHNRLDWQLTDIEHYKEHTGDTSVSLIDEKGDKASLLQGKEAPSADIHAGRPEQRARHIRRDRGPDGGQVQGYGRGLEGIERMVRYDGACHKRRTEGRRTSASRSQVPREGQQVESIQHERRPDRDDQGSRLPRHVVQDGSSGVQRLLHMQVGTRGGALQSGYAEQLVEDEARRPAGDHAEEVLSRLPSGIQDEVGVIVEMVVNREAFLPPADEDEEDFEIAKGVRSKAWMGLYVKADLPPQHFQDMKAMSVEKFHPWCESPKQLLAAIPQITPIANNALTARKEEGAFDLAPEADEMMHAANWDELFSIHKQMVEEVGDPAASGSGAPP